jgi:hypothetical protein
LLSAVEQVAEGLGQLVAQRAGDGQGVGQVSLRGQIVRYDDYMDPIAMARLLGRTSDLVAALKG